MKRMIISDEKEVIILFFECRGMSVRPVVHVRRTPCKGYHRTPCKTYLHTPCKGYSSTSYKAVVASLARPSGASSQGRDRHLAATWDAAMRKRVGELPSLLLMGFAYFPATYVFNFFLCDFFVRRKIFPNFALE